MKFRSFLIINIVLLFLTSMLFWAKKIDHFPKSKVVEKLKNTKKFTIPEIVNKINIKNSSIVSLSCEDVEVKIWRGDSRYKLFGEIYYEKTKNFRLRIKSILGEELDLGSNNEIFWYWSRRDLDPGLHYAHHEDYNKTRLKSGFDPNFMMESFGINKIVIFEDTKIINNDNNVVVVYNRKNGSNQPILFSVFIDKSKELIVGFLVTDLNGVPQSSVDIQERKNGIPTKILYVSYLENKALLLEFKKIKINKEISKQKWGTPNKYPRLNMAND